VCVCVCVCFRLGSVSVVVFSSRKSITPKGVDKDFLRTFSSTLKIPPCSNCIPQDTPKSEPYFEIADKKPLRVAVGTCVGERTLVLCLLIQRVPRVSPHFTTDLSFFFNELTRANVLRGTQMKLTSSLSYGITKANT